MSKKKTAQDKTVWDKKIHQLGLRTRGASDALSPDEARDQARVLLD